MSGLGLIININDVEIIYIFKLKSIACMWQDVFQNAIRCIYVTSLTN